MIKLIGLNILCLMLCVGTAICEEQPVPKYTVLMDETLTDEKADQIVAAAWMGYGLSHANWLEDHYKGKDATKDYRESFDEEVFCRDNLAQIWLELKEKHPESKDIYLDQILAVRDAGFLKEYVWVYHKRQNWTMPDGLKLEKFKTWADRNLPNHQPQTLAGVQIQTQ